jgi:hypothetical protein
MNLNQLYKNINETLAIPHDECAAIMGHHGGNNSKSTMQGYYRKPDSKNNRYRPMLPPALLIYCRGIIDLRPPDNPAHLAALLSIIDSLSNHQRLTLEQTKVFNP